MAMPTLGDTGTAMMTGHAFIDLYYETYDESVITLSSR